MVVVGEGTGVAVMEVVVVVATKIDAGEGTAGGPAPRPANPGGPQWNGPAGEQGQSLRIRPSSVIAATEDAMTAGFDWLVPVGCVRLTSLGVGNGGVLGGARFGAGLFAGKVNLVGPCSLVGVLA